MANITADDLRNNEALAHAVVENEPAQVTGVLGLHALARLAETTPHKDFAQFVNDILGQINQQQQQQPTDATQQPPAAAAAAPGPEPAPAEGGES